MTLYEGPVFRVERREGRDVVVHPAVAAVIAVDRHDRLTLVRQYRVPVDTSMLELPAGFVDDGESPLEAARRELAEETGLHGGEWAEVATFFTSAGFTDETLHLFLATGLDVGEASPDEDEDIQVARFSLSELPGLIAGCRDAKTLVGLLLLARYRHL
jgi:ADP-ribose diphosphatase